MSAHPPRARARARYRDANARDSADHPHNESTLRRAILPGCALSLSLILFSFRLPSRLLAQLSHRGRGRGRRLDVFIIPVVFPRSGRAAALNEMSQVSYRLPSLNVAEFSYPAPTSASAEISRDMARERRNAPEMTAISRR